MSQESTNNFSNVANVVTVLFSIELELVFEQAMLLLIDSDYSHGIREHF